MSGAKSSIMRSSRVKKKGPGKSLAILAAGGLFLTGCTLASSLEGVQEFKNSRIVPLFKNIPLRKTVHMSLPEHPVKPTWRTGEREKISTASVASQQEVETITATVPPVQNAFTRTASYRKTAQQIRSKLSARCRRILAEAGIEATILRSPSLSGEVGDSGNVGASISYDFMDMRRANLQEELATATCHRDALLVKLNLLLFTSSQALTRAGYLAKASALESSSGEMAAIKRRIRFRLSEGSITRPNATNLQQRAKSIEMRQSLARGEAARREIADRALMRNYKGLDRAIADAEWRIQEITRRKRTTDAIKISASAGYTQTNQANIDPGTVVSPNDYSAKIRVSLRLGALRGRRHELEDVASDARVDSLFEQDRGVLWRANEIGQSNYRVLSSLRKRRGELREALASARSNATITGDGFEEELTAVNLRAQIDVIALRAELAGVNATIADTEKLYAKLRFKG